MGHELIGDLFGEGRIETAPDVDRSEFPMFALVVGSEFLALKLEVGPLSVRLGVNRNILACGHRHSPRDQAGNARYQHAAVAAMRSGHTEH
jgi:hypothetical protein